MIPVDHPHADRPLCTFVSDARIPCPAYAAADSAFCAVHREVLVRVTNRKMSPPVRCVRCHQEIAKGTLQKITDAGPVHAEFACGPHER